MSAEDAQRGAAARRKFIAQQDEVAAGEEPTPLEAMQKKLAAMKRTEGGVAALQLCLSKQTDPSDPVTIWLKSQKDNMLKFDGENAVKKMLAQKTGGEIAAQKN